MKNKTTTQKTAANSSLLRGVKKLMNAKIYAKTRLTLNQQGEAAAIAYLQNFFSCPVDAAYFIELKVLSSMESR